MNSTEETCHQGILPFNTTIRQAIRNLDEVAIRIVLVTSDVGELLGTISDGDIRRGLLKEVELNSPIKSVMHRNPSVVPEDVVLHLMAVNNIQ